jgi:hypothetical protein
MLRRPFFKGFESFVFGMIPLFVSVGHFGKQHYKLVFQMDVLF